MMIILALLLAADTSRVVSVRYTETAPRIDGVIEDVWLRADPAVDFVQHDPDEGQPPSERTEVFVLQDRNNLYVAFRCHAAKARPIAALYGMEEEATVFIDPMDSRNSGYFFKVYGSGLYRSGKILDDGNSQDWSWDAVWFSANRLYDDRWEVEFRIPFKSIRYKQGATEWGVNFHRFITQGQEHDYWTDVREREGGNRVSQYGRLVGIDPQAQGYYFELYPEGFVRYDEGPGDSTKSLRDVASRVKPRASLNLKWDITPQTTVNATALPDFAQIESDPYSFNLSRYPTYFGEQRPFFVEGSELFRMSALGQGNFSPLHVFYSRRIGKAVGQEPVPILGGLKLTSRSRDWSFGALGAVTDELTQDSTVLEPRRGFGVLSTRGRIAEGTDAGLLFAGTTASADNYNCALGLDLTQGQGFNRNVLQAAVSDRNGKLGWALNTGYRGFMGSLLSMGTLEIISDSFAVDDIGYAPWAGRKRLQVMTGPYITPRNKALTRMYLGPGFGVFQEPGSREYSYSASAFVNANFRDGWYLEGGGNLGRSAEADTVYFGRGAYLALNRMAVRYTLNSGLSCNHGYNYRRGFVADNYSGWVSYTHYLARRVALMLMGNSNWECDPTGRVAAVTTTFRPKIDYRIDSRMTFNVYDELVLNTPGTRFDSTKAYCNRVGFLYSWNFRPKSWLYVAFNDFRVDFGEGLKPVAKVGAIKLRYLFYF